MSKKTFGDLSKSDRVYEYDSYDHNIQIYLVSVVDPGFLRKNPSKTKVVVKLKGISNLGSYYDGYNLTFKRTDTSYCSLVHHTLYVNFQDLLDRMTQEALENPGLLEKFMKVVETL